jgi:hypothetical protein
MIIIYPYYYDVMEIPPRCRKPRPVQHTGELEVEIREPSETEAPVALVLHSRARWSEDATWYDQEFRWFDERFWVRRDIDERGLREPYALSLPDEPRYINRYSCAPGSSGAEHAENYIRHWAQDQILIAGQVWRPWAEPLLKIGKIDSWKFPRTYEMRVEYSPGGYGCNVWYYPLTMWNTLSTTLRDLAGEDEKFWKTEHCRFDILMPETIRWPIHHHYEFYLGNGMVVVRLKVEAPTEEEAVQEVREGLADIYPDLTLGNQSGTILSYPKVQFHPNMVGRAQLVRRVSGLEKLLGEKETDE